MLGVEWILSASAVGSLQERYRPLDIVVPDQFLDRTPGRISTFFGRGLVAHITFARPLCDTLSGIAHDAGTAVGSHGPSRWRLRVHRGSAVFDAGRVASLPLVADGYYWDDQPAGGQARA